jgi:acetoin utilization deacetylase AcuC-like enzyme
MTYPTADEYRALINFENLENNIKILDEHYTKNKYYKDDQRKSIYDALEKIKTTDDGSSFAFNLGCMTGSLHVREKLSINSKQVAKTEELVQKVYENIIDVLVLIYKDKYSNGVISKVKTKIKVFYSEKQNADTGEQAGVVVQSPSARKPKEMFEFLQKQDLDLEFVEPNPVSRDDFKLVHDSEYVDDVLDLKIDNGFGTRTQSVADSLPYTTGAMCDAVLAATAATPTCALVSGFHHAGYNNYNQFGYFCTFNGLVVAAKKFGKNALIVDCDQHWGNGTDDILNKQPDEKISHISFGKYFSGPEHADSYLKMFETVEQTIIDKKPEVIIYQSGADVHVDDPYGGCLTTEQMYERDLLMFKLAKKYNIPVAWNLAGGYQVDADGNINKVLNLHLNTFKACEEVYKISSI